MEGTAGAKAQRCERGGHFEGSASSSVLLGVGWGRLGEEGIVGHGKGFPGGTGLSSEKMTWSGAGFRESGRCSLYHQQGKGRNPF